MPAHHMVQSGQWLVTMLYGRIYQRKPPLFYWTVASAEKLTGSASEIVWRLPSVLSFAFLAVVLGYFTWRWFGKRAGMVAGLAPLAMVCLWSTARCADVDMLNILLSVIATLCLLELYIREPRYPVWWMLASGLAIGGALLTKGPAGIPDFGGVWIFSAFLALRSGRFRWLVSLQAWMPLLLGLSLFGLYVMAAHHWIVNHGYIPDTNGVREGAFVLFHHSFTGTLVALLLAPTLLAYGMPVTLPLFAVLVPQVRHNPDDPRHEPTLMALAGSIIACWALCFLSGMTNPRYGYVMIPLFAPVAGVMVAAWPRLTIGQKRWFVVWPIGVGLAATAAHVVLCAMSWKEGSNRDLLLWSTVLSVLLLLGIIWFIGVQSRWNWAWVLPVQFLVLAIPFALHLNQEHWQKSGYAVAQDLRQVVGVNQVVYSGGAIFDQPEIFYYSGVNGYTTAEALPHPDMVAGNQWVLLKNTEFANWNVGHNDRLVKIHFFRRPGKKEDEYLLAWLLPKPIP